MPYTRDFELVVPSEATLLSAKELQAEFGEHLQGTDLAKFDHYHVRIAVQLHSSATSLGKVFYEESKKLPRRDKRRSFSCIDSVFIALSRSHEDIAFREVYPLPPIGVDKIHLSSEVELGVTHRSGAAEVQNRFRKNPLLRRHQVVSRKSDVTAMWDFRQEWFRGGFQPEIRFTCSVAKGLKPEQRYVQCQQRLSSAGRSVVAPEKPKRILLPI